MPSSRSLPPELCCLAVSPSEAAICRPLANWRASPTAATSAEAIIGPTPRSRWSRLAAGSLRAIAQISRSSSQTRSSSPFRSSHSPLNSRRKRLLQPFLGVLQPTRQRDTLLPQLPGRHQPVLGHQAADLVGLGCALLDQAAANAVHRLDVLLLEALHRYKAHARPRHPLADRLGVIGIVLVALHIRLHELRGDQLHRESSLLQPARPVVRSSAGLHADLAARLQFLQQRLEPAIARQPPAPDHLLVAAHTVNLKHVLCQINSNADKLHSGLLLPCDWWIPLPVWHLDAEWVRRGPSHCFGSKAVIGECRLSAKSGHSPPPTGRRSNV